MRLWEERQQRDKALAQKLAQQEQQQQQQRRGQAKRRNKHTDARLQAMRRPGFGVLVLDLDLKSAEGLAQGPRAF